MHDMKPTRRSAAAALFAACLVTCFATCSAASLAAPGAGAAAAPDAPGQGAAERGADEHGPAGHDGDGPHHGFGGPGSGAPGPGMPFHEGPFGGLPPLHGLKLSEAQQDKLFAITYAQAPQQREHDKAIRKAEETLRELRAADKFDDARASAAARDLGQAITAQTLLQARTEARILAVLTPEQRAELRERHQHRHGWMERMDQGGRQNVRPAQPEQAGGKGG
jgi:protein CpxP